MKKHLAIALSMVLLASGGVATSASAQEATRAQVRQELVQAENNGLRLVTDTSYPDVNPLFVRQVARQTQDTSGAGADMTASGDAGQHAAASADRAGVTNQAPSACVGPVSFCNIFFGS